MPAVLAPHAKAQQTITFNQSGVTSAFTGTVLTVDGVNYNATQFPVNFTWNLGDTHNFTFMSPLNVNASYGFDWNSTIGLSTVRNGTIMVSGPGTVNATYGLIGDFNLDGTVDAGDLLTIALAYHSQPGNTNWNQECDLANQGVINLVDIATFAMHYGDHY